MRRPWPALGGSGTGKKRWRGRGRGTGTPKVWYVS